MIKNDNDAREEEAARRRRGTGGVEELPSGRFRVRLRLANGERRSSPTFDSREDAERFARGALAELAETPLAPAGAVTLAGWGDRWLDRRETSTRRRKWIDEKWTRFASQG